MSCIEAECSIIKKDGEIIGVSLVAMPQTEAEKFCDSMPQKIVDGNGDINFEDGRINFVNPGEGEVSFSIEMNEAFALQSVLNGDKELGLYRDGLLASGFKIVFKGMEDEGEKVKLTRL